MFAERDLDKEQVSALPLLKLENYMEDEIGEKKSKIFIKNGAKSLNQLATLSNRQNYYPRRFSS